MKVGEAVSSFHTVLTSSVSLPGDYLYPTSHVSVVSLFHQHSLTAVKIGQAFDRSRFASGSPSVLLICRASQKLLCVRNSSEVFWLCDLGGQSGHNYLLFQKVLFYIWMKKYINYIYVTLFQTNNCSSAQIIHKNLYFSDRLTKAKYFIFQTILLSSFA